MKEFKIFVLLCVGTCLNSHAQTNQYRPFIEENKVWHVGYFPGASLQIINGGIIETRNGFEAPIGTHVDIEYGQII